MSISVRIRIWIKMFRDSVLACTVLFHYITPLLHPSSLCFPPSFSFLRCILLKVLWRENDSASIFRHQYSIPRRKPQIFYSCLAKFTGIQPASVFAIVLRKSSRRELRRENKSGINKGKRPADLSADRLLCSARARWPTNLYIEQNPVGRLSFLSLHIHIADRENPRLVAKFIFHRLQHYCDKEVLDKKIK